MNSEKAPELKERLDMLSEGATPGPYGVESYGSGTTYVTLGTWPGHYASDTVPPMGYGRAEIVTTNIPRAWGEVGRKGHTAHFLTELANAYRAGKLVTADVADAMVAEAERKAVKAAEEGPAGTARALEIILSRLKFDDQTASILKYQLGSERKSAAALKKEPEA